MAVHVIDPMQMLSEVHLQHIWRTHELTSVAWNQAKFSQNREFEHTAWTKKGSLEFISLYLKFVFFFWQEPKMVWARMVEVRWQESVSSTVRFISSMWQRMTCFYVIDRYFRHAYGEMYVITHALARFVSINRSVSDSELNPAAHNLL